MPKIKMTRTVRRYGRAGEVIDATAALAAKLCRKGWAVPVRGGEPEKAVDATVKVKK